MIERKYLVHYIDAAFDLTGEAPNYVRLGRDLEEFTEELNPDVTTTKNIWGEQSSRVNGYNPQSEVSPYYADYDDPLFEKLAVIANERKTGDALVTTKIDALVKANGEVVWAYRERVKVVPSTAPGGDTSGVQIPFTIYSDGERTKGTWAVDTKKFTPAEAIGISISESARVSTVKNK